MEIIGILHPGEMGISIAASAKKQGHAVYWVPEGRSAETRKRAESQGLAEAGSLDELCRTCSVILSVCPPHAAEAVAEQVLDHAFSGLYADLNAISPQRALRIGERMEGNGVAFVDGGIIGGPAWQEGSTWLYLAGSEARRLAVCFIPSMPQVEVIGAEIGKASALKMCFAAYTKGSTALLCAISAAAEGLGVRGELERQWSQDGSDFAAQTQQRVRRVTAKAWRFAGEMEEIAATFEGAGLPGGFHLAAAEVYRRMAGFQGAQVTPELAEVLAALQNRRNPGSERSE